VLVAFSKRPGVRPSPTGEAARTDLFLSRWTSIVLRFRAVVLAIWLAVAVAGALAAVDLPGRLSNSFDVPRTDSQRADSLLGDAFGERADGTFTVVFRTRHSSNRQVLAGFRHRLENASALIPHARLGELRGRSGVVFGELRTTLDLKQAQGYTDALRRALGPGALVTGEPAIQHDITPVLSADRRRAEAFAFPLALLVIVAVLGFSLAAAVPFVFAACTIGTTLVLVDAATRLFAVPSYTTNFVELIGLGLAVDYSLLILCRHREQLAAGQSREVAVVETMASAGRAILFSGAAVAIGIALLLAVPVPFVRALGVAGLLVPVVSTFAAVTLEPVLLSLLPSKSLRATRASRGELWSRIARAIMRRPLQVLVPAAVVLLAAAAPLLAIQLSPGSLAALPGSMQGTHGLAALAGAFGPGAATPTEIVVDAGEPGAAHGRAVRQPIAHLVDDLFHDPEVSLVATGSAAPYVSHDGRYARVFVVGRHEYGDAQSQRLIDRVRGTMVPASNFPSGVQVLAGGAPARGVDFLYRSYGIFPWLLFAVLGVTYAVLARAFRSLLLPLKAVVLNLLSVAASTGLMVVVFQLGVGAGLLGVDRVDAIDGWVPIVLFATMFGLSMDYEVFLVSRMREAWDAGADNAEAVATGLAGTGGLISAAALIMAVSFSGFLLGSVPALEQLGFGLAVAVLVDATVLRILLVPSFMAVLGRWNWWLPARAAPFQANLRLKDAFHET
jgi:RND superfamily putative drug exporter